MTYQQVWDGMSKKERMANQIMCYLKVDENGKWVKNSIRNKILYRVAKLILGGSDPLDKVGFYGTMLDKELFDESLPEFMAELYGLKIAWNRWF